MLATAEMDQERLNLVNRLAEEAVRMRLLVLSLRDEEIALLENDSKMLDEVMEKIKANKKKNYLQNVKYKSKKAREEFEERQLRWRQRDASEPDWRMELPPRQPQIRLNMRLLWPGQKCIGHYRQLYRQLIRRPESRLGEKCIQALRARFNNRCQDVDGELDKSASGVVDRDGVSSREESSDFLQDHRYLSDLSKELFQTSSKQQVCHWHADRQQLVRTEMQERAAHRILSQIAETRESIQHWPSLPPSERTRQLLDECRIKRQRRETGKSNRYSEILHVSMRDSNLAMQQQRQQTNKPPRKQHLKQYNRQLDRYLKPLTESNKRSLSPLPDDDTEVSKVHRHPNSTSVTSDMKKNDGGGIKENDGGDIKKNDGGEIKENDGGEIKENNGGDFKENDGGEIKENKLDGEIEENDGGEIQQNDSGKKKPNDSDDAKGDDENETAVWREVLSCKYIRGYEPPEAQLPDEQSAIDFVFGGAI